MVHQTMDLAAVRAAKTERIAKMEKLTQNLNEAGVRKTELFLNIAESLRETVGQPRETRRALAFAHHLGKVAKPVYDDEQIIGSITGMCPVDPDVPDLDARREEAIAVLDEHFAAKREGIVKAKKRRGISFDDNFTGGGSRFALMARDHYEANIKYLDLQQLIGEMTERYASEPGVRPGEIGKVLEVYFNYDYGDETRELMADLPWNVANHTCLDYPRLVKIGYDGVREQVRAALAEHPEREVFYNAMLISLDAASKYIHDYAQSARLAAKETESDVRREELHELARVCDKIADQKPDTFFEAMELVWMTHLIANVDGGSAMSIGRFDQYMRPFFEKDYADGTLSIERARELIAALWLKLNEPKMRTVQSCCLAGVTPQGEDGASLLTQLCLEVTAMLKLPYPNLSVRIDIDRSPEWLYDECIRTIKAGAGMPMILNDKLWVNNFIDIGLSPEDARDYYNMGCVEMLIQSKQPNWGGGGGVDLPWLVLDEINKKKDEPLGTFDEFMDDIIDEIHKRLRGKEEHFLRRHEHRSESCDPFASALVDGCIDSGRDFFDDGTRLGQFVSFGCGGLGTATDSLCAIRKHVYEDKDLTLQRLYDALKANYEGYEDVHALMQDRISYGNDDDEADMLAKRMFDAAMADVKEYNKLDCRDRFISSLFSYNGHISGGESLGATPDGRHYGEPISDCLCPVQGRDVNGPTATLNSLLKLDTRGITGAHAMNLKINSALLSDKAGTDALMALIKAYLEDLGPQLQINYVDANDLIAAQKEPEKYKNLVVRIAGYCEYFVNLDRKLQGEIISRTLHEIA